MKKAPQIKRFGFKEDNSYKRVAKYFETRYKVISLHEASAACFDCAMVGVKFSCCFYRKESRSCALHNLFISGTLLELAVCLFGEPCATEICQTANVN